MQRECSKPSDNAVVWGLVALLVLVCLCGGIWTYRSRSACAVQLAQKTTTNYQEARPHLPQGCPSEAPATLEPLSCPAGQAPAWTYTVEAQPAQHSKRQALCTGGDCMIYGSTTTSTQCGTLSSWGCTYDPTSDPQCYCKDPSAAGTAGPPTQPLPTKAPTPAWATQAPRPCATCNRPSRYPSTGAVVCVDTSNNNTTMNDSKCAGQPKPAVPRVTCLPAPSTCPPLLDLPSSNGYYFKSFRKFGPEQSTPSGVDYVVSFSGYLDVPTAIEQTPTPQAKFPLLSLGGGSAPGPCQQFPNQPCHTAPTGSYKWTVPVIQDVAKHISLVQSKGYKGMCFDVEGTSGSALQLMAEFQKLFQALREAGLIVMLTTSHNGPYAAECTADGVKGDWDRNTCQALTTSWIESKHIDILSPQLYTSGWSSTIDWTTNNNGPGWEVWNNSTPKLMPSVSNPNVKLSGVQEKLPNAVGLFYFNTLQEVRAH